MNNNFSELNLDSRILQALDDIGYEEATAIQTKAIPVIMSGRDVIGQSRTGTGKTAAFSLPAIAQVDMNRFTQVLVVCPTRELAIQACEEVKKFTKYIDGFKTAAIYGGQSIDRQIKLLRQGVHMVIGTPGRLLDHISRHTLKLQKIKMVVLDEADEMLNMGFREDIEEILTHVPEERQTVLFSATMPAAILAIADQYQNHPELIKVDVKQLTVPKIHQYYYDVPRAKKLDVLCTLLDSENPKRTIIFCNTKRMVDSLTGELQTRGYLSQGLHGDMRQVQRTKVMNSFKDGNTDILIATDVAARGIDVEDVDAVINYDIPTDSEYYVHRIGRTGRAGKEGTSYTFAVGKQEANQLKQIMHATKSKITLRPLPSVDVIQETKIHNLVHQLERELKKHNYANHVEIIDALTIGEYTPTDIACALINLMTADHTPAENQNKLVKLTLSVGKNDRIEPKHILGAITSITDIAGDSIGKIRIEGKKSTVEVMARDVDKILEKMSGIKIKGMKCKIEMQNKR